MGRVIVQAARKQWASRAEDSAALATAVSRGTWPLDLSGAPAPGSSFITGAEADISAQQLLQSVVAAVLGVAHPADPSTTARDARQQRSGAAVSPLCRPSVSASSTAAPRLKVFELSTKRTVTRILVTNGADPSETSRNASGPTTALFTEFAGANGLVTPT